MNTTKRIEYVNRGDLSGLFREELGWNRPDITTPVSIDVDSATYEARQVAGYKGIRVWQIGSVPDGRTQRLIDAELRRLSDERLIVFCDDVTQDWRWPQVGNTQGRGQSRLVTHTHRVGTLNQGLDQRLAMIEIGLSESPTVLELLRRMRSAFDADKVTREFYKKFVKQHDELASSIRGIDAEADRKWYSAMLMNRLMFIYFMQRKGFMDNDRDYLRTRLLALRGYGTSERFYEFYRDFLIPMFHEGLGAPELRTADPCIKSLIGDVPYINGGIFSVHELENAHRGIHVPDEIFESIFDLFDSYQWHLDDRPASQQNEINPDVLGYIFEQFVNDKDDDNESGAYYTKDDVTAFMTSSVVFPVFLERLQKRTGINPWVHVASQPTSYVWDSMSHGMEENLPVEVEQQRRTFPRPLWGELAPEALALPGETWWEVDHRRESYRRLIDLAGSGGIVDVNAAVTANLDLESLTIQVIDGMDTPSNVVAAWNILTELKILDPTCGSGAFLFAALKILLRLYSAVLDSARAQASTSSDAALHAMLQAVDRHPNQDYFVLKHATLNNLYGVDIMKEATEIARLRLFLKLVSAIDSRKDLEPLPDLDFNIKAGNVLVGARNVEDVGSASDIFSAQLIDDVLQKAGEVGAVYEEFRAIQESGDYDALKIARTSLAGRFADVREIVDKHYHAVQGIRQPLSTWVESHTPFHWFIEFPEVLTNGGFDVVIGNPPYVARRKISRYAFTGFVTDETPDIYAPCTERAAQVTRHDGRLAMILPISAQCGRDFSDLRRYLEGRFGSLWLSTFARNPAALFSARVGVRSTILVAAGTSKTVKRLHVTKTHRWFEDYRPALFETLAYVDTKDLRERSDLRSDSEHPGWMRFTDSDTVRIFEANLSRQPLAQIVSRSGVHQIGFKQNALYWLSVFPKDPPAYNLECTPTPQTKVGRISFLTEEEAMLGLAIAASKFGMVWWYLTGNDYDVTSFSIRSIPVDVGSLSSDARTRLVALAGQLVADLPNHVMFTKYKRKWMGNFVLSEMRYITDQVDAVLADELGHSLLLPALEHAYYCAYKPTGDRPGTLRFDPCKRA